jgi:hypothetical protein
MNIDNPLVDLAGLSQQLKLSKRWLRMESTARRIPSLKAGGKRLFNVEAVRQALALRAADEGGAS